jgi:hypothetical protein
MYVHPGTQSGHGCLKINDRGIQSVILRTGMFITVFTRAPTTGPNQELDDLSHLISEKSILILPSSLRTGLPSGLYTSGNQIKILYTFLISVTTTKVKRKHRFRTVTILLFPNYTGVPSN